MLSPIIQSLIEQLRILPSVGRKSAQRMALHLLEKDRDGALLLAKAIVDAVEGVSQCQKCRNFSEADICAICEDVTRDSSVVCVVEQPMDVLAIEHSGAYQGLYFVLMGHLSPLDGIGPNELGLEHLVSRLSGAVDEVILATNPTVEGEATASYIADLIVNKYPNMVVSRIAHGVPMGGELEYVDGGTLSLALSSRQKIDSNY